MDQTGPSIPTPNFPYKHNRLIASSTTVLIIIYSTKSWSNRFNTIISKFQHFPNYFFTNLASSQICNPKVQNVHIIHYMSNVFQYITPPMSCPQSMWDM